MEVLELLKELHDKRRGLIDANRERLATLEAKPDAELQQQYNVADEEITDLGQRIGSITTQQEQERSAAADREKFETLIHRPETQGQTHPAQEMNAKVRNWLRAGLADAQTWAPKAMTFSTKGIEVKHHHDGRYEVIERHDLTKGTATDGAELVPTGFVARLFEHLIEFNAIRRTNATVLTTDSGENLLIPKTTSHGTAALVAEAGPFTENDPQFDQVTAGAYKFGQMIQVSRELVEDTAVDLLGYLARAAGRALGVAIGTYHITGTGTSQPQGIAASPTAGVTGAAGTGLTVSGDSLIDLYHSLISGYRANGYWVMADGTAAKIRKLRDDSGGAGVGNYLWQPGLVAGAPDTLLGRPVVTDPAMAAMAINAYSIAFGDFSEYFVIRDVDGVRFERSDDYAFANDLVTFRSALRTDSRQVVNGSGGAVKFYRNGAS